MNPSRRLLLGWFSGGLALLLSAALASPGHAQQAHSEEAVKAAYLYRFASYVEWPQDSLAGHPFVIGVVGDPGVAHELRLLLPGHLIDKQVVQVRDVGRVQDVAGAQMLYVGADHANFLREMSSSGNRSILIVTDEERGLDLGGVLNFVTVDKRVRFEVSLTAAERAQLKISADLLSVAIRVHGGRRQSDEFCIPFPLPGDGDGDAPCGIRQARRVRQPSRGDDGKTLARLELRTAEVEAPAEAVWI
jgi:hypothetical protein